MSLVSKQGKNRPTENFKNYFAAVEEKVNKKPFYQAIDNEVRKFIKDDPVCSNAEIKSGTGLEIFMARLKREIGYLPRSYKRKTSRQRQAWGEATNGPDFESKFAYMRSGKNAGLAQSCFYLFIILRDDLDHASNIEARVGIEAYSASRTYKPATKNEKVGTPEAPKQDIFEFLEQKSADVRISAKVAASPTSDGMDIVDSSAFLPLPDEHIFCQNDLIFFHVETRPRRSLILLLTDQHGRYWMVPGPSYAGPTGSNLERIPAASGFGLDKTGPHRFVVVELDSAASIYTRSRTDSLRAVFSQQEKNLISVLTDKPDWRWGEVSVFVKNRFERH